MIYISFMIIITVIVSITYFSYAFYTHKDEQHGKLNIVAGTLDYKIKSSLLDNTNSIVLASYEKARLNIEIESLNEINSRYELYYTTTNNNIEIGYTTANQQPTGAINSKSKKVITVIIKNPTNSTAKVTFGVQGGLPTNTLALSTGNSLSLYQGSYCEVATNTVYAFDYTGSVQEFAVPCTGDYKLETWGAQGGSVKGMENYEGAKGGYSVGNINVSNTSNLYVVVGGQGTSLDDNNVVSISGNSYNGGGLNSSQGTTSYYGSGSGGATHIATITGTLESLSSNKEAVLIVAGGGGGSATSSTSVNNTTTNGHGGAGGGNPAIDGMTTDTSASVRTAGTGATITTIGRTDSRKSAYTEATFGAGCKASGDYDNNGMGFMRVPGGGGYYGGGCGIHSGGGGGSGYVGGTTNGQTIAGNQTITEPDGTTATGHSGNGYARITFLSESTKEEKTKINYIVTFDANGGSISTSSKTVSYNSPYGYLPTPIRSGYTFKGWNGKNMFNESNVQINKAWNNDNNPARAIEYIECIPGSTYTLSFENIESIDGIYVFEKEDISDRNALYIDHITSFTTKTPITNYLGIQFNKNNIGINDIMEIKFQLEEGSTATAYEPYYITSSTNVVQTNNHTLTAIWEKN